jgi:hypothetical protein
VDRHALVAAPCGGGDVGSIMFWPEKRCHGQRHEVKLIGAAPVFGKQMENRRTESFLRSSAKTCKRQKNMVHYYCGNKLRLRVGLGPIFCL